MDYKALAVTCLTLAVCSAAVITPSLKSDPVGPIVVHATGNQSVPSIDYVVDAVETLKQAAEIFPAEPDTAKTYAALFSVKHPGMTWNVAVGYTTLYINSSCYVEVSVSQAKQLQAKVKDDKKAKLYMIFSSQ